MSMMMIIVMMPTGHVYPPPPWELLRQSESNRQHSISLTANACTSPRTDGAAHVFVFSSTALLTKIRSYQLCLITRGLKYTVT